MEHRKALRKRKHLEEEEAPSVKQEALSSCSSSLSEVSDTLDKDYKPGPGEESPRPLRRRICHLSSTSSTSSTAAASSSTAAASSSTAAASSSTAAASSSSTVAASSSSTAAASSSSTAAASSSTAAPSSSSMAAASSSSTVAASSSSTAAASSSSTAAASSSTAAASSSTASRPPTRCTVYRRKKRAEKDRDVLARAAAESSPQGTPGGPCDICGHPRRLEAGHAFYQGQFFCSMEDGPGGRTPQEWLAERMGPADVSIPRTTLWRMKKKALAEEEEEEAAASQPERKKKKRKPHTCQRCGQPAQKAFGHSQFNRPGQKKEYFCALFEGKSLELWLAERRAQH